MLELDPIQIIFDAVHAPGCNVWRQVINREEDEFFDLPVAGFSEGEVLAQEKGDVIRAHGQGIFVDTDEFQFAVERCADFFACFTDGGFGDALSTLHAPAGEIPFVLIRVLDEQDLIVADEHDPHAKCDRLDDGEQTDIDVVEGFEKESFHLFVALDPAVEGAAHS